MSNMKTISKVLCFIAVVCFIISAIALIQGHDKKANYESPGTYTKGKNAYVGGDAYNYIINSNYATGHYVIAMGNFLAGIALVCTGLILDVLPGSASSGASDNSSYAAAPMSAYSSPATSASSTSDAERAREKEVLANNGWKCVCGRVNYYYQASCVCGKTRGEVEMINKAREAESQKQMEKQDTAS